MTSLNDNMRHTTYKLYAALRVVLFQRSIARNYSLHINNFLTKNVTK